MMGLEVMQQASHVLMLSAMYENGGNVTHRLLDGHPELFVYPFESQLGTRHVVDMYGSMFPSKYRWPEFALSADAHDDYQAIIDEECKTRLRTPFASKFRDADLQLTDEERAELFCSYVDSGDRTVGSTILAFFRATFEAWHDRVSSGLEHVYVGYSPIIVIDADRMVADLPQTRIVHIVRNPWSAYSDTKRRPVPLPLDGYIYRWAIVQRAAIVATRRYPDHCRIVRFEDIVDDPVATLGDVCAMVHAAPSDALAHPTWNSVKLQGVFPWGVVNASTSAENRRVVSELSDAESAAIEELVPDLIEYFGYTGLRPANQK